MRVLGIFTTDKGMAGLEYIFKKTNEFYYYKKTSSCESKIIIMQFTKDSQISLIKNGREFCVDSLKRWSL